VTEWPRAAIVAAGLATAAVFGAAMAVRPAAAVALLVLACFLALVVVDLPVAVGLLVFLAFVNQVPFFDQIQNALGAMVAVVAIRAFIDVRGPGVTAMRQQRWLLVAVSALLLWMLLSLVWAVAPDRAVTDIRAWVTAAAVIPLMIATLHTPRDVQIVLAFFVLGATVDVAAGLAGFQASPPAQAGEADPGRLRGLEGDPNILASLAVAAILIACGLLATWRSLLARGLLVAAIGVLAVGFLAAQSRGGLIAALVVLPFALLMIRRRRRLLAGVIAGMAIVASAALIAGLSRGTDIALDNSSGRNDLWRVALQMSADHPLTGVGPGGFAVKSAGYSRDVGPIDHVELMVEKPQSTHNIWLQLLVETGVIGVALCLAVVAICLRAGYVAAKRFRRAGRRDLMYLVQSVTVASGAMLAAGLFIASSGNRRMWVLLALAPILLGIAAREPTARPRA
jgi:O-antigen ligase